MRKGKINVSSKKVKISNLAFPKSVTSVSNLVSVLFNGKSKSLDQAKISYFKRHGLSIHEKIVKFKVAKLIERKRNSTY